MNARERFGAVMNYGSTDRKPFYEWLGFWNETVNRWYGEGLPIGMNVWDYFDFDEREHVPIDLGPIPRFIPKVLEEDNRYKVCVDENGTRTKILKTSVSMPSFIDFPVKDRNDWKEMKKRYDPSDRRRYPKTWSEELISYYENLDKPVGLGLTGFFGITRNWMGLERLLRTFHMDPALVREMMEFWTEFQIQAVSEAVESVRIDYATIWEDMAYVNGPLISPRFFRDFMVPCYKKTTDFLKKEGIEIIMVDTDGDHNLLTPLFIEGGVNCLYPLEAQSHMDALTMRKKFGKDLRLIANVDKKALAMGPEYIEKEIERVRPLMEEGGFIASVDHAVPSDVPFANYVFYIDLLKREVGLKTS